MWPCIPATETSSRQPPPMSEVSVLSIGRVKSAFGVITSWLRHP